MNKMIYFDMDNTLNDFYRGDWLEKLRNFDVTPYVNAPCVVAESTIQRFVDCGYSVGIISWCSKVSTKEFDKQTRKAKKEWLKRYYPNIKFSEIHIIKYGTPKHSVAKIKDGYLFDDNEEILNAWKGVAINATMLQMK